MQVRKMIMIKPFRNLKWYEWTMMFGMVLIGGYYAITDKSNPSWYIIINYFGSIAGVFCIFLCAHASWPNWIFAIINTTLYIVVLAYNSVYGTLFLELLYYFPTNFIGLIHWRKHPDDIDEDKCKVRILSIKMKVVMILFVVLGTIIIHFFLKMISNTTVWLDSAIVSIGVIATFYEIKRFADQYYLWLITDIIAVVQWIIISDPIMITKKSIYLVMAIVGLLNWINLQRNRNAENI